MSPHRRICTHCNYDSRVVQVAERPTERLPGSTPFARWTAAVVAVVLGVGLGALGTALVTPGQSLAVPTAIVASVGGAIALVVWVVASFRAGRQAGWIFAIAIVVVTVLAGIWTFEFELPVAIEWSDATAQANDALSVLEHSPQNRHGTVPLQPCVEHTTGSVGPLAAPYKECAIWTPVGHLVSFVASSPNAARGSRLHQPTLHLVRRRVCPTPGWRLVDVRAFDGLERRSRNLLRRIQVLRRALKLPTRVVSLSRDAE